MNLSRYVIGIDLGTTTCSLAYVDTMEESPLPKVLPIEQWEREQETVKKKILPSCCYVLDKKEIKNSQWNLAFCHNNKDEKTSYVVGRYALQKRVELPSKVIHSAKSWLCHKGVNPRGKLLPWSSDEIIGSKRYSPVEVLAFYLEHLKNYWDETIGSQSKEYEFSHQDIIMTIPASFDEVASKLTLEAAELANYHIERVQILEEPQASFYDWLQRIIPSFKTDTFKTSQFQQAISSYLPKINDRQQNVLICDIGGGTTDFSLFEVSTDIDHQVEIKRVAVSEHILLGGDNIDLSLAGAFEKEYERLHTHKLSSWQWAQLVSNAKEVKEKVLEDISDCDEEKIYIAVANQHNNLFKSSSSVGLSRKVIKDLILDGFFPGCSAKERPKHSVQALKEWGLPYAFDPAISRHLAEFVCGKKIDAILYAGGTLLPQLLQNTLTKLITNWQQDAPVILDNQHLELSVACGASVYGFVHRQKTLKIKGGYPRSLYIEVTQEQTSKQSSHKKMLCVLSQGFDSFKPIFIDSLDLKLLIGKEVSFRLYYSIKRPKDSVGDLITVVDDQSFKLLAVIQTKLENKKLKNKTEKIPVSLEIHLSHNRILNLYCCTKSSLDGGDHCKWDLSFNVQTRKDARVLRPEEEQHSNPTYHKYSIDNVRAAIEVYYGKKNQDHKGLALSSSELTKNLESLVCQEKKDWDLYLLRSLWSVFFSYKNKRIRSPQHESAWLNLAGFFLRPGFGDELDSMRVEDAWQIFHQGVRHQDVLQVQNQWWIFWRRISGGLQQDAQNKLFSKVYPYIKNAKASPEMIMAIGSLELVDTDKKILLGQQLLTQLKGSAKQYSEQKIWALTRLANRHPLYAGPDHIIRPFIVERWLEDFIQLPDSCMKKHANYFVRFFTNCGRVLEDREFDLSLQARDRIINQLNLLQASAEDKKPLHQYVPLDKKATSNLFGESLPLGIVLVD